MVYKNLFKRVFDIIFSILSLLLCSPILLLFMIIVYLKLGSPIFFRHSRPGHLGETFEMVKFRTMTNCKGNDGKLLPNYKRITPLGDFLRKTSIDELPEFFNVLKGEMSIVGPRPLELRYLPLYSNFQKQRHNVKPGITGWAQVNGRNSISWEEKFELDIWYVKNVSFTLDIKIILLTIIKVFARKDINENKTDTVVPFDVYLNNKKDNFTQN